MESYNNSVKKIILLESLLESHSFVGFGVTWLLNENDRVLEMVQYLEGVFITKRTWKDRIVEQELAIFVKLFDQLIN